jgi:hypothetical protein
MGFGCRLARAFVHSALQGTENMDVGNALISVVASKNRILSSALPSQSMERGGKVILNNAMLAYKDMQKK